MQKIRGEFLNCTLLCLVRVKLPASRRSERHHLKKLRGCLESISDMKKVFFGIHDP
jgi:hypothetical protein